MKKVVEVLANREELIARSLSIVLSKITAAIEERGQCTIALAGGSTPDPLYRAIATQDLPWDKIHVFWGDERYVRADHPDSNQKMARLAWLDHAHRRCRPRHRRPDAPNRIAAILQSIRRRISGFRHHFIGHRRRRPHCLSISPHSSFTSARCPGNSRQQRRSTPHHLYSSLN
jgi:6-phosphogluconolactonase/glucosamine-6-phosphate isomerase/deaminase